MEDDLRRIFTATQQTRIATRSATPAQISAKTSVVRPNMNVSSSFFSTSSEAYVTCVAVTPSTVMVAESSLAATPRGSEVFGYTATWRPYVGAVPAGTVAVVLVLDFKALRPPLDCTVLAIVWARTASGAPLTS